MTLFYNTNTDQIYDYNQLKAAYPASGSWPASVLSGTVDYLISNDPGNPKLTPYPTIHYWERLYQVSAPTGIKLTEIAEKDALPILATDGKYYENWTVRARTTPEMIPVNLAVAEELKTQRELVRTTQIDIDEEIFFDSSEGTQNAISRLILWLTNKGEDVTTTWKGYNDGLGFAQWSEVTTEDLQNMSIMATEREQKSFKAEADTFGEHMVTPFEYMIDVINAYIDNFNNL